MTERIIPSDQELLEEMKRTTVYPSGSENIGKEPVTGEKVLEQDKDSKLYKGIRVAAGITAFLTYCSMMGPDESIADYVNQDPTWLNQMFGTAGEVTLFLGSIAVAGGKHTQEIVSDVAKATKEYFQEEGPKLKEGFVKSLVNARAGGAKLSKRAKSYAKRTIEAIKGDKTEEFSIYRPRENGEEGVELDTKIVTTTNKKKDTKTEATYKMDNGNLRLSTVLFEKMKNGGKNV
ncbi:MAG: hypothetical protein LBR70_03410 [Lactobacillaceae bacterium]|jgi:hypothetical protein|nr:hypothetical protein [Lactobacillaceae bacterium]